MSSEYGHFSIDDIPDNMVSWLKNYSNQIQWLRKNGITKEMNQRKADAFNKYYKLEDDPAKAERLARWSQSGVVGKENKDLYNYGFPIVSNNEGNKRNAPAGCTVAAVAQLLYYHQWPKTIGPKDIPSYTTKTNKILMSGFKHGTAIQWNKIYRTYSNSQSYNDDERTAIATLMKMIGVALKADYKYGGSARLMTSPSILMSYFSYDDMEYISKLDDENEWLQMIYNELVTNGPVLYRGENADGGAHTFLIEGIDGNEVWINFGWGEAGSVKSQLSLCSHNIYDHRFPDKQSAVFGVRPYKGEGKAFQERLSTNAFYAMTNSAYSRQSPEEDFSNIPLQLTFTNTFDDNTYDIGYLVENIETGEQHYYTLFSRKVTSFNSSTSNIIINIGKDLEDGVYRIYGASRKYGTENYFANYNKSSKYIEITIQDNQLYFGEVEKQNTTSLSQSTHAAECDYKLYSKVNYSDTRTNGDGAIFYRTDLYLEITKNGVKTRYLVDEGNIYSFSSMSPCMMLDLDHDKIYIFHNSKSDDPYYGMTGYIYSSPLSSINFTCETIYDYYNCGWIPYFIGLSDNGYPILHHFSFAGYYEVLSQYEDGEWNTFWISDIWPDEADKDAKAHSSFLVIGDNSLKYNEAAYYPSETETNSYTLLSVDSNTSGDYTIPETVEGIPINSIASYAFSTCDNITSITIPETITSIEEYAFRGSSNLTSIKVMSPTPIDLSYSFEQGESGDNDGVDEHYVMSPFELVDKSTCILYVPRGSYEAYAFAVGWGDFKNIIEYDDVSSIENIQNKENMLDNYWYSISGVVYKDKPTVKGIYIHNGKKIIIE